MKFDGVFIFYIYCATMSIGISNNWITCTWPSLLYLMIIYSTTNVISIDTCQFITRLPLTFFSIFFFTSCHCSKKTSSTRHWTAVTSIYFYVRLDGWARARRKGRGIMKSNTEKFTSYTIMYGVPRKYTYLKSMGGGGIKCPSPCWRV